jgi:hypothetical protein
MAGPTYRGLRLDRSVAEFHRAVDRLRFDTDSRRTEPASATPTLAPRPPAAPTRAAQPALDLPAPAPDPGARRSLLGRDPQGPRAPTQPRGGPGPGHSSPGPPPHPRRSIPMRHATVHPLPARPPRCEVPWSFASPSRPCPNPAYVVIADPHGTEAEVCEPHWRDALRRSGGLLRGVRLVPGGAHTP